MRGKEVTFYFKVAFPKPNECSSYNARGYNAVYNEEGVKLRAAREKLKF